MHTYLGGKASRMAPVALILLKFRSQSARSVCVSLDRLTRLVFCRCKLRRVVLRESEIATSKSNRVQYQNYIYNNNSYESDGYSSCFCCKRNCNRSLADSCMGWVRDMSNVLNIRSNWINGFAAVDEFI